MKSIAVNNAPTHTSRHWIGVLGRILKIAANISVVTAKDITPLPTPHAARGIPANSPKRSLTACNTAVSIIETNNINPVTSTIENERR